MKFSVESGLKRNPPRLPTYEQEQILAAEVGANDIGLAYLCAAYDSVSSCRSIGYGAIGPIWQTAIWEWCDRHQIYEQDLVDHISAVISHVDSELRNR